MSKAPHFPQQPVARQNEDGSLELECYVDANPKPEIKWFYDNVSARQNSSKQMLRRLKQLIESICVLVSFFEIC